MHVLSFTFGMLSFCGVWLPIKWESQKQFRFPYLVYTIIIVFLITILVALQIVLLTVSEFNTKNLTEICFTLLTVISFWSKTVNTVVRRKKIINLADMLLHSYCHPRDPEECRMKKDVNEFIRIFTIGLNALAQGTGLCLLIKPIFQDKDQRELPCKIWVPYDLHDSWKFWLTWSCEFGAVVIGVFVNATTDVLVSGFVLQACLQFDFLDYRLRQLVEVLKHSQIHQRLSKQSNQTFEERTINETIVHHNHVIKFAKKVTQVFDLIIIQQFIGSAMILSVIIYELCLGNVPRLIKFMAVLYIACMISELFSYCWFGNEITLKSMQFGDEIYKLDWSALSKKSKKTIIFIMLRTSHPVVMSYGSLITLNIESFKSILKVTYTVFNVLKESSE